jgi:RNA-directed DNA polymerase
MTTTSIKLQEIQKRIGEKAKADPHHRFWGLYTHVWKLNVLGEAYRLAKKNNGAPGVDGETFAQIEERGAQQWLEALSLELREKTYRPLPCRQVTIPKEGNKTRGLKIPAIRDRVVQGALRLVLEPIFEADFQPGSYSYRPNRTAHQALERVSHGLNLQLHVVIDLDLASYYDTVRHDLLLSKLARRVRDKDVLHLCKLILKAAGKRGIPQGSVIGPLWANVFLNDVDRMLEKAQQTTREGRYETVRYARFADDLVVLISRLPHKRHWVAKVERRLREELGKLDLKVNEEKSKVVEFAKGETFDFLGFSFRWIPNRKGPKKGFALVRPMRKRRTRFLRALKATVRRCLSTPVEEVVRTVVNPRVRGWVNYFRWGNSSQDLKFVRWKVDTLVRRFASRQRPMKRKGGSPWTAWSNTELYDKWGLYNDYRVAWGRVPKD